tara:strand:- start:990 stop:2072 length:1083 start_codon:yes stop_codon:yes gene_type:complete
MTHLKQTYLAPASYPPRACVGDNVYDWDHPDYHAVVHTAKWIIADPKPEYADAEHVPSQEMLERKNINRQGEIVDLSSSKQCDYRACRFMNPRGKTGIAGRGMLGRWGPNWAADVIVTKTEGDELWVLLCEKQVGDGDSVLCFPAGMVEPGDRVPETLRRELCEEAVDDNGAVDELFDKCCVGCVYAGWVDDWRNTDHAWMVTQAYNYHATPEIAAKLTLAVKDKKEIKKSAWYLAAEVTKMYASHKDWLDKVLKDDQEARKNVRPTHPSVSHDLTVEPGDDAVEEVNDWEPGDDVEPCDGVVVDEDVVVVEADGTWTMCDDVVAPFVSHAIPKPPPPSPVGEPVLGEKRSRRPSANATM